MKYWIFVFVLSLVISCKEETGKTIVKPGISGGPNDLLIVMDADEWKSVPGDTMRAWFKRDMMGLPQRESVFSLINVPRNMFERNLKTYRSIIYVSISPNLDSTFIFRDSPWASTQKYYQITAPSRNVFCSILEANKKEMERVFLAAERDRLLSIYKRQSNGGVMRRLESEYDMKMTVPADFLIQKAIPGFIWMSAETSLDSRGIVAFMTPFKNEKQLEEKEIIATINTVLSKQIPGPAIGSYMSIDTKIPVVKSEITTVEGNDVIQLRGMWTVVNDFMAGPCVLNVTIDKLNKRVIYLMGYVYYPNEKKRNMLRQVESIMYSIIPLKSDDTYTTEKLLRL